MRETLASHLPWLLSVLGVIVTALIGNKVRWVWGLALLVQAVWLVWAATASAWGLFPLLIIQAAICVRNHLKWTRGKP